MKQVKTIERKIAKHEATIEKLDVINSKNYTTDEVKKLFKHFVRNADFIDFTREYGIKGWDELDKWLEQNVK